MKLPKVTDLVKGENKATFICYKDGELWYGVNDPTDGWKTFEFPVPKADLDGAIFFSQEKALSMMRWIRKHIEFLGKSLEQEKSE